VFYNNRNPKLHFVPVKIFAVNINVHTQIIVELIAAPEGRMPSASTHKGKEGYV